MNPNQPDHIPSNFTRPLAASRRIANWGGARMFSKPAKDAFDAARKMYKRNRRIARIRSATQPFGPYIPETSAGSPVTGLTAHNATFHIDRFQGLSGAAIEGYLRIICNYANEWHQRMDPARNYTGVDAPKGPLKGGSPLFYVADVKDDGSPYVSPSPEQFWMMRYLFVPVFMPPKREGGTHHVALLVICPVTKTLDYLDSDNTPIDTNYTHGLIGRIMEWMATFLNNPRPNYTDAPPFIPEEWQFRDTRSRQQGKAPADCGVYVVTQAQYMAFGYDHCQSELQNWPVDSAQTLSKGYRRYRIASDLTGAGLPAPFFSFFNPAFGLNHIQNHQYYPILDTPPVIAGDTWRQYKSHPEFATLLTSALRNRRTCYVDCRLKSLMVQHCRRNLRFYPCYSKHCAPRHSLKRFREWVEFMDESRRSGSFIPKPYDKHGCKDTWPRNWIDPRERTTAARCRARNLLDPIW